MGRPWTQAFAIERLETRSERRGHLHEAPGQQKAKLALTRLQEIRVINQVAHASLPEKERGA